MKLMTFTEVTGWIGTACLLLATILYLRSPARKHHDLLRYFLIVALIGHIIGRIKDLDRRVLRKRLLPDI